LPQKRPLEGGEDDEEGRGFKIQRRKLVEGLGEIYDPGKIVIAQKRISADEPEPEKKIGDAVAQEQPEALKWSTKRWRVGGMEEEEDTVRREETDATDAPKETNVEGTTRDGVVAASPLGATSEAPPDKGEPEPADSGLSKSMFKKRKAPSQPVGQKKGVRKQL